MDEPEGDAPGAGTGSTDHSSSIGAVAPAEPSPKRFRRARAILGKIPHPPLHSRLGMGLVVGCSIFFTAAIVGGTMWFIPYSESVAFCTTCHTMVPQHKAYELSAHSDVPCGECHVAPGIAGWVHAKIGGTQELKALILNNFPTPIPPIPHAELPSSEVTCMKCHQLSRINTPGNPIKLILKPRYELDKANTEQMVAVAIRPTGLGSSLNAKAQAEVDAATNSQNVDPRGVHWHVATPVSVYAADENLQVLPLVEYTNEAGVVEDFIASREIGLPTNVTPDITRLKAKLEVHTMQCIDCHNMVGHDIPDPAAQLDLALQTGAISTDLPYIKRDALTLLTRTYNSDEQAARAITNFAVDYAAENPVVAKKQPDQIAAAAVEIGRIYNETATPAMKTTSTTYPNNLGHQRGPGCFRCHDGTHVKVVNGKATDEVIPATCSTCHTFPQVGQTVSGLQLGVPPASHSEPLYVFNHKNDVPSVAAAFAPTTRTSINCSTCHQKSYCENCHNTGAVKVTHDEMLYNHANAVKRSSLTACAYCHQPVYCATCHEGNIMAAGKLPQARLETSGNTSGG